MQTKITNVYAATIYAFGNPNFLVFLVCHICLAITEIGMYTIRIIIRIDTQLIYNDFTAVNSLVSSMLGCSDLILGLSHIAFCFLHISPKWMI